MVKFLIILALMPGWACRSRHRADFWPSRDMIVTGYGITCFFEVFFLLSRRVQTAPRISPATSVVIGIATVLSGCSTGSSSFAVSQPAMTRRENRSSPFSTSPQSSCGYRLLSIEPRARPLNYESSRVT